VQSFKYVPYEPIVGNIRKVGETVFLAELRINPAEFASRVPEGFQVVSDKAYVAMTEASLRDEKRKDYPFINPIYSQYYSAGILVEVEARGHRGWTYAVRDFDRDWAVMESRIKGLLEIRDCVRRLIDDQTNDRPEERIKAEQKTLIAIEG